MKKGTKDILVLGGLGAAAYFLFIKPKDSNPIGDAIGGFASGAGAAATNAGLSALSSFNPLNPQSNFNPFYYPIVAPLQQVADTAAQAAGLVTTFTNDAAKSYGGISQSIAPVATKALSTALSYNPVFSTATNLFNLGTSKQVQSIATPITTFATNYPKAFVSTALQFPTNLSSGANLFAKGTANILSSANPAQTFATGFVKTAIAYPSYIASGTNQFISGLKNLAGIK